MGVANDATVRDIKKQYRRLSLTMHPDKNPDNPLAVQEFMRLTKAYKVSHIINQFQHILTILNYVDSDGRDSFGKLEKVWQPRWP